MIWLPVHYANNSGPSMSSLLERIESCLYSIGMGWADNVLLAMGPLGIMTTIVSAIRVGRVTKLKAMVGR